MTWVRNRRSRINKDDVEYCIEDQTFDERIDLPNGVLLVRLPEEGGITVEFAVLGWSGGPSTDVRTNEVVAPSTYEMVFHGSGPSGGLRELRHTWWGAPDDGGYLFYPDFTLLEAAFKALRKWFD
jgi:hypothetical protein